MAQALTTLVETGCLSPEGAGPIIEEGLHALRDAVSIPLDDVGVGSFHLGSSIGLSKTRDAATIIGAGMPVLVLHGPFSVRAALILTEDALVVRPLPPLVPSTRLRRAEIASVEIERGHWYAPGKSVVAVRRHKGPALRLMEPSSPSYTETETLGPLIRAWFRAGMRRS